MLTIRTCRGTHMGTFSCPLHHKTNRSGVVLLLNQLTNVLNYLNYLNHLVIYFDKEGPLLYLLLFFFLLTKNKVCTLTVKS